MLTFSFKRPILEGATFDRVTGLTSSVVFEGAWHGFGALGSALGTESARFARHTTACIYENDVPTFRCQQGTSRPPRAPPKTCHQAGKITFRLCFAFRCVHALAKQSPGALCCFVCSFGWCLTSLLIFIFLQVRRLTSSPLEAGGRASGGALTRAPDVPHAVFACRAVPHSRVKNTCTGRRHGQAPKRGRPAPPCPFLPPPPGATHAICWRRNTRPRRATRGLRVQGCSTQSCKEYLHRSAPWASPQARQARPHIPLRSHIHSSTIRPGLRALLLAAP